MKSLPRAALKVAQRAASPDDADPDASPVEAALYEDMTLDDWRRAQGLSLAALTLRLKQAAVSLKPNHPGAWGLTTVWRLCRGRKLPEPFEMQVIDRTTDGAVTEAAVYRAARDCDALDDLANEAAA